MAGVMQTLWDLLKPGETPGRHAEANPRSLPKRDASHEIRSKSTRVRHSRGGVASVAASEADSHRDAPQSMQARYDAMVQSKTREYGVRVRKWRTAMSGIAWQVEYRDGTISRLIEAPRPKGPMSAAVFLHEIGHHAIGFNVYKPRCLEEYHAWMFALREMESHGLNVTESVRKRMHNSLRYAIEKASRRGLRSLPAELVPYVRPWSERIQT